MTLADQLNHLAQNIDVGGLPDVEQIASQGGSRRRTRTRRRVFVSLVAAVVLGACAVLSSTTRPSALTPVHTDRPAVGTVELRTAATVGMSSPTDAVAASGSLWVVGDSGVLAEVDPARNTVTRAVTLPHPGSRVVATDGSLWVLSSADNVVMQVDRASLSLSRTVSSRPGAALDDPRGIAVVGNLVWVVNYGSSPSTAVGIDDRYGTVTHVTTLPGSRATGPVPNTLDRPVLWILIGSTGALVRVDAENGDLLDRPLAGGSATCGQGQLAYQWMVWSSGDDPGCAVMTREVDVTGSGEDHTYAPGLALGSVVGAGGQLWASDHEHTIYRIDRDSGAATPAVQLGGPVTRNRLVAGAGGVWVLREQDNQVVKLTPFMVAASPRGR